MAAEEPWGIITSCGDLESGGSSPPRPLDQRRGLVQFPKVSWQSDSDQVFPWPPDIVRCRKASSTRSHKAVLWQRESQSIFLDYSKSESDRIEAAYHRGAWMMRMKSNLGKNAKPREIYFADMVEFDPATEEMHSIRRLPALTPRQQFSRFLLAVFMSLSNGEEKWWKPKPKESFDKLRIGEEAMMVRFESEHFNTDSNFFKVAHSWWFNMLSMLMIVLSSFYIWVDADLNEGTNMFDTAICFTILDNVLLLWYIVEASIRFRTFRTWWATFDDNWFVLDMCLLSLMLLETWVLQIIAFLAMGKSSSHHLNQFVILRLFRLLRLARIVRLFKVFPQLFILVKGMFSAMSALFHALMLLFVLTFAFAVMFKTFAGVHPELATWGFDSVGGGCWNLLVYGFFLDSVGKLLFGLKEIQFVYAAVLIIYIFISNLTILNMLVGVLCEVIARTTSESEETLRKQELERSVLEILECYDLDDTQRLSKEEFRLVLENPDLKSTLQRFGIDIQAVARLEGVLFVQKELENGIMQYTDLRFSTFLEKINQLSSGSHATLNDMVELRNWLRRKFNMLFGLEHDSTANHAPMSNYTSVPNHALRSSGRCGQGRQGLFDGDMSPQPPWRPRREFAEEDDPSLTFQAVVLRKLEKLEELQAAVSHLQADLARQAAAV